MKKLLFIIEKSGSMSGLERNTIGGFMELAMETTALVPPAPTGAESVQSDTV